MFLMLMVKHRIIIEKLFFINLKVSIKNKGSTFLKLTLI